MIKFIVKFFVGIIVSIIIGFILYLAVYYSRPEDTSFSEGFWLVLNDVLQSNANNKGVGYFNHIAQTIIHFLIPFILSAVSGVSLGILFSLHKKVNTISNFFIDFLRVLPSIVFITLFKYNINVTNFFEKTIGIDFIEYLYLVVLIASVWPIIIATKEGVQKVNSTSYMVIQQLNIPWWKKLKVFILPEAFPNIFNGIKISIAIAFLIAVTCEYITPELNGLGALLKYYENISEGYYFHSIIVIISIGIVGLVINFTLEIIENKLSWLKNQYKTNDFE